MNTLLRMLRQWRFDLSRSSKLNMKISLTVLTAVAALVLASPALRAAEEEGVALAILYDTSGSMKETVPDKDGRPAAKYLIANRALTAIAKQIDALSKNPATGAARRVDAAL